MEPIERSKEWFFSDETKKYFDSLTSVEDRTVVIYSYFANTLASGLDKDQIFKISFLLADAVYNSGHKFAAYPKMIAPLSPFAAFVTHAKGKIKDEELGPILLGILYGQLDPFDESLWIYDEKMFGSAYGGYKECIDKLSAMEPSFLDESHKLLPVFEYPLEKETEMIHLAIEWIFGKAKEGK